MHQSMGCRSPEQQYTDQEVGLVPHALLVGNITMHVK